MKRFAKMLIVSAILILSLGCFSSTSSAATKTSVVALKKGKTSTIKNASKVTSSKKNVATAEKKSSTKYKITAKKAGKSTLKVYNKKGKLTQKIYLLVYTDKTMKYNTNAISLTKGSTKKVQATVPNGCTVKYSSTDKSIAKVNANGKITAVKKGTATIKAKVYYKNTKIKTFKKSVTVTGSKSSSSNSSSGSGSSSKTTGSIITWDNSDLTIIVGDLEPAAAKVSEGYYVKYSSSDTKVARVTSRGTIYAEESGTATITAVAFTNDGKEAERLTKKVIVIDASLSNVIKEMEVGDSEKTSVVLASQPSSSVTLTYEWILDNSKVVSLKANGSSATITAKATGTADIIIKINGREMFEMIITVKEKTVYPDYDYTVYLVSAKEIYSKCEYCIYVKTDNPDPSTFQISMQNQAHTTTMWDDVNYASDTCINFWKVDGGYVGNFYPQNSGTSHFKLYEWPIAGETKETKTVKEFDVNVIDFTTAETDYIDSLIEKYTTSSMDPFAKLEAVLQQINVNAGYTYKHSLAGTELTGYTSDLLHLTTDCGPWWIRKTWDSSESPAVIAKIAERIGEFDYINDLYDDYTVGSSEWSANHYFCEVGVGDEIARYGICPSWSTGVIDHITYVDFSKSSNLTKLG